MNQKWILVAEDNDQDADFLRRALWADEPQPSIRIELVCNGLEALDCLYRRNRFRSRVGDHPALVLLDLKMPEVDGWEVLRRLKTDSQLKTIPVVVFTSSREEGDLVRSYQLGANAYVVKPVEFKTYVATVKVLWDFWMRVNESPPGPVSMADLKLPLPTAA